MHLLPVRHKPNAEGLDEVLALRMHAGTAEPWRVTPPEAVAYLIELGGTSRVGNHHCGDRDMSPWEGAISRWLPAFHVVRLWASIAPHLGAWAQRARAAGQAGAPPALSGGPRSTAIPGTDRAKLLRAAGTTVMLANFRERGSNWAGIHDERLIRVPSKVAAQVVSICEDAILGTEGEMPALPNEIHSERRVRRSRLLTN